jgi:hypothetical protein
MADFSPDAVGEQSARGQTESTPVWFEAVCGEDDHQVRIGPNDFYISADGLLMPTRKDQPPPDLRFFSRPQR